MLFILDVKNVIGKKKLKYSTKSIGEIDMSKIRGVKDIDNSTIEGKLLLYAIGLLSTQPDFSSKHPEEVLMYVVKALEGK